MNHPEPRRAPLPDPPEDVRALADSGRTDYTGAVYGSLLAASVIAASDVHGAHPRFSLIVLLLVTGIVFWLAHVYAHLAGERESGRTVRWHEVRRVGRHEWSIVEAAVLPALAVLVSPWLGTGENAWLAIGVAVAQQVTWAVLGARRAGASNVQITVEAVVNLALGLLIVVAKVAVGH
ncbi:hypothetical protein [Streptacidiphilus jiangxiensis]|uniref:Integral membrane protein n=1 Tax=Streptacidiphilus jiangxiensis TaxID=235985 RepID=A0A1H7TA47_STRJI|nr:hypothetical protein [Streptacidiphilus jiangxiensis]SEL81379.1 hypothetical protein SAMN05414137_113147 [Streptacidiphilus jiangxiensis]